jgi:hypothetical protein
MSMKKVTTKNNQKGVTFVTFLNGQVDMDS